MRIRKATSEDLQSVYDLVVELAIFEKEPEAVTSSLENYNEAFESGLIDILILEVSEEIIGMALYYESFSTWKGKMLYLEDFIVKTQHRGKGYGQALFDAFITEAKQRSCVMAKWQVLDWNKSAITFYEKKGSTIEKGWWNGKIIFD